MYCFWHFPGANFAFSIYDFDGSGQIDAFNLGDVLRALNTNPTLATIEKLGGTKKKGEKKMKVRRPLEKSPKFKSKIPTDSIYVSSNRSMNSSPSSARSRRTRTKDATRTSLSAWNCTTRKRTAKCSQLSLPTPSSPLVIN